VGGVDSRSGSSGCRIGSENAVTTPVRLENSNRVNVWPAPKYMGRSGKPPSPSWRTFRKNHLSSLASIDCFVVPTVAFQVRYVFVVLRHDRRRIVYCSVTTHPTAAWVSQHIREVFLFDPAPRYLIRDRDGIYGTEVRRTVKNMSIQEVRIALHSPWQNPFVERVIGTIRRECLDDVIVLNERHLERILRDFFDYYHVERNQQGLGNQIIEPGEAVGRREGEITCRERLGGLLRYCYGGSA
jgi:putative transposase